MTDSVGAVARNFGLDVLRAVAITAVLLFHASPPLGLPLWFQMLAARGWMGVDLFFVLSGYLIGLQSFTARAQPSSAFVRCSVFWVKRWTRTVPLYVVVLFFYVVVKPWLFHAPFAGGLNWKWLVFLQNFGQIRDFGQSWSLCIEEQFYFVFPMIVFGFERLPRGVWLLPVCFSLAVRLWTAHNLTGEPFRTLSLSPQAYVDAFRYRTAGMLDSISIGVFLASCRETSSQWPTSGRSACGLLGAFLVLVTATTVHGHPTTPVAIALTYSVLAIGFGAILIAAEQWRKPTRGLSFVQAVAIWSYSTYLWHELFTRFFARYMHVQNPFLRLALYLAAVLGFSKLSYELIEKPGLSLRSRLVCNRPVN